MPHPRPLVSVVVPAFNAAGHLAETIDSILRQTMQAFEVIIVDDGSTDDTVAIATAAQVRDRRIRLLRQGNRGVGAARNAGISVACGDYVAPLDADDLWAPRKLEKQVERFAHASSRTGLVYCWSRNIDASGRVISWAHPCRLEGPMGAAMLLGNLAGNASVPLFRTSALHVVGRYLTRDEQEGAQGCEDWDLNLRFAEKFEFRCAREYLVSYRQSSSAMSLQSAGMLRSYRIAIQRAQRRNPRIPPHVLAWSESRFYAYLAGKCYIWSDYAGALVYITRMLRRDPVAWLNPRHHRMALLACAHLLTGGALRRHRKPPAITSGADPLFRASPGRAVLSPTLFSALQERRLSLTRRLNDRGPPLSRKIRPVFG